MPNIKFEDRAVAFIDVLGFKGVVNAAGQGGSKHVELEKLIDLLESAVPNLDGTVDQTVPKDLIPRHIYISDSIILSAPLTSSQRPNYRGLSTLVMRVIQISHTLLSKGYLLRGGISIGSVWHTTSNIVGPAYQEAYEIETKTEFPRIELSPNAKSYWMSTEDNSNRICLEHMDKFIVNILHDYYIPNNTKHGAIEEAYEKYERIAKDSLSSHLPESAKDKWRWFQQFLQSEKAKGLQWETPIASKEATPDIEENINGKKYLFTTEGNNFLYQGVATHIDGKGISNVIYGAIDNRESAISKTIELVFRIHQKS